ncbi:GH92 family glycosyl hydrolase [Flavobacterium sp.]|uniref:GH92 family glycosyl hydrolase n=1 Tax=Flavobacterium sp. TaxID=239 RepID=UPI00122530D1|nr:GH92 family glycosyl hydrolase [Flavobacterium sp.]RZJ73879.1 MAG: glycoside hydrolase family 92 protein [Flavobacterium sp.]
MTKRLLLLLLLPFLTKAQMVDEISDYADWANPLIGTQSNPGFSNGNTYPAIAMPWGMNFWSPQTNKMGHGWMYGYTDMKIRGFKQTHQPSPWMNDYGQFSIMPTIGKIKVKEDDRASFFSHKAEVAKPYYYSVYLADYDMTTEIAPTERAAIFRFSFKKTDSANVLIDAFDKGSYVKIIASENKIVGYTTKNSGGVPANFKNYFVIKFDRKFERSGTFSGDVFSSGTTEIQADHTGAVLSFRIGEGEQLIARVASSFISQEQAELNLNEVSGKTFDGVKSQGKNRWNEVLGKVKVAGGTIDQMRTFYSCLYRSTLFPRKFYEFDKQGNPIHYSPYNGKVLPGYMFTDTGFWDTFRALFPFVNLVYPEMGSKMQEGLANAYKEGGWLPEWASPGYRDIMVGNNSASIVSEAYLKGLRGYDIETLYQALLKGANAQGPLEAVGRAGSQYYTTLGYVPYDVKINENAARTIEYAYDDFAIYQLAKLLKKPKKEIELYRKRSLNYKNLFDKSSGLMRGKNKDGKFQSPFNPFKWGDAFTEGNSWHYTWCVFHDIKGLSDLMGGKEKFAMKLDSVFSLAPIFDDTYYGGTIHEIREMQVANMGQYAHGNQPIQHMPYLYNYAAKPWKTQYWVREIINRMYLPTPDGYCGDEDNGQTSAWYVFSALGFYPVTPASNQYVLGAPLFKKAEISLENGKKISISAEANSDENRYVNSATKNGRTFTENYLKHDEMLQGIEIRFEMAKVPNTKKGTSDLDAPYSLSDEKN